MYLLTCDDDLTLDWLRDHGKKGATLAVVYVDWFLKLPKLLFGFQRMRRLTMMRRRLCGEDLGAKTPVLHVVNWCTFH